MSEIESKMKKLNFLADAAKNAGDPGLKQIWTDKWSALIKAYGQEVMKKDINFITEGLKQNAK